MKTAIFGETGNRGRVVVSTLAIARRLARQGARELHGSIACKSPPRRAQPPGYFGPGLDHPPWFFATVLATGRFWARPACMAPALIFRQQACTMSPTLAIEGRCVRGGMGFLIPG